MIPSAHHGRTIEALPKAGAMLEALRGLGYGTAAALADIIDNSVSAGASLVEVRFVWDGDRSRVTIVDDGCGMTPNRLLEAMRLGERDPRDDRSTADLGRFGLGLKTASFSQCRRLTVASRTDGLTSCLCWDLDRIAVSDGSGWMLLEGPASGSEDLPAILDGVPHGTLVAWEILDRIVTPGFRERDMLHLIDQVERHLAMVFHRFLEGPRRRPRIRLNGTDVPPWDPFLADHPDTWSSPEERIATTDGVVRVRCHVLPHRDRLDAKTLDSAAGPEGWTAQQGFYVYRQDRLLMGGSWLGLGRGRTWTKEEPHRLARIRVDIPNSADAAWRIDVRKSVARPPVQIRDRLAALAIDTRERARRVFAYRGGMLRSPERSAVVPAWRARHLVEGMRYEIDEEHPAVAAALAEVGRAAPQVRAMLRVLQETVPVQRIWLDTAENRETPRTNFDGAPPAELMRVLLTIYRSHLRRRGLSPAEARRRLLLTEPFDAHPDAIAALPDDPGEED